MSTLLHWLTSPEWALIVRALLHSLWLGALIAVAIALGLRRMASPTARYRLALTGLGAVLLLTAVTWGVLNAPKPSAPLPAPVPVTEPILPPAATGPVEKIVVVASRTATKPATQWTAWLALAWLLGASVMLGRASVKVAGAEQLRRSCQPLTDSRITELVAEARRAVQLTRQVRVAVTNQLTSPAVVGVLVPTLILPLSLITTLSPEQLRFILLHELAHIRRGDYLANLFQLFAEALLFFNPAVWWLSHQIRREREACCDALAIELSGAPADYARTLVSVAETMLSPSPAAAPAFGNDREPSALSDRVQRALVPGYRPSLRLTWRAMLAALVAGSGLLILLAAGTRQTVAATAALLESAAPKEVSETDSADVVFQLRLVQTNATPDTETMVLSHTNTGSGKVMLEELHVQKRILLGKSAIKSTSVEMSSQPGRHDFPVVNFSLTAEGTKQFARITRENIGQRLAIVVEGKVVSAPVIRSEIPGGHGQISGSFSVDEAQRLAAIIQGAAITRQSGTNGAAIGANTNLHSRTFKVDPNTFWINLQGVEGLKATNIQDTVREFFGRVGVALPPPKAFYFNDRSGNLFVRATLTDLDIIEQAIRVLATPPPQVHIRAMFVEVPMGEGGVYLGNLGLGGSNIVSATQLGGKVSQASNGLTGILTASQASLVLKALEQREGVEIVATPSVSTISGRQAQIQIGEFKTIITGTTPRVTNGITTIEAQTTEMPMGPTLDIVPIVSPDGHKVEMTIIPTIKEFLGYDDPGPATSADPIPRFRVRQLSTSAAVMDGQTLVIGGFVSENVWHKPGGIVSRQAAPKLDKKHLLVFITPTIIDAAGNRVDPDETVPFGPNAVPKQSPAK